MFHTKGYEKPPYIIAITGATTQISQALILSLGYGYIFGIDGQIVLKLYDIEPLAPCLEASKMEIQDCSFDNIVDIVSTTDPSLAFKDADLIIMIGCVSRREGMERRELLGTNVVIFSEQAKLINIHAKPNCKILVTGNPSNTNGYIVNKFTPNIPSCNISTLARLDQNRATAQIALKLNVEPCKIENVIIFGNHSKKQYAHAWNATCIEGGEIRSVAKMINNDRWLKNEFVEIVRERGHEIIKSRKATSGCSVSKAILDHIRAWHFGSKGKTISVGIESKGEYQVPEGLFFNFPVKISDDGIMQVDTSIELNDFDREMITENIQELENEKNLSLSIVNEHSNKIIL